MTNWPPLMQEQWFVVARSEQLKRRPLAISVLGIPLVLGRSEAGVVFAFEDRCPHRQVPLSAGRITEDGLQCRYHGWSFGSDGKCRVIPGWEPGRVLPSISAKVIVCTEINDMIWIRLVTPAVENARNSAPPLSMTSNLNAATVLTWQTSWKTTVIDAIENFLDPLHTHTIHPGLVRKNGQRKAVAVRVRQTADGFNVDYEGQQEQSGLLYRLFEAPRISERAVFAGAASARIEYRYKNDSAINITLYFTPETPTTTHVFARLEVSNRWAPKWALRLFAWPILYKVVRQDQEIVELQSDNKQRFRQTPGVSTELDLVRPYLAYLWEQDKDFSREAFERDVIIYL